MLPLAVAEQNAEWTVCKGRLCVEGGVCAGSLAEKFGTPLYVYNAGCIRSNYTALRKHFPHFVIAYSMKANPALGICTLMHQLGARVEVASGGEIGTALAAGFPSEAILFAGPAKEKWELTLACQREIGIINVESIRELEFLCKRSNSVTALPQICVRVNSRGSPIDAVEKMVGGPSRFGIDEEELPALFRKFKNKVNIVGLHVYCGSQILNAQTIVDNFSRALRTFAEAGAYFQRSLTTLVFGGGFGVRNQRAESSLDLAAAAEEMRILIASASRAGSLPRNLVLESGRFLVANAGLFITKIVDIKSSRGELYILTDGGINNFLRPAFMHADHEICLIDKLDQPIEMTAHVGGPLCTPLDEFAGASQLPHAKIGDLVGIFNAGAYGFSMSMHHFLGHAAPAEVLVDKRNTLLLRARMPPTSLVPTPVRRGGNTNRH